MGELTPRPRSRAVYLLLLAVAVSFGLILHSRIVPIPMPLRKYSGDALWALTVFLGLGLIFNRTSIGRVALAAYLFAAAIEFSQLYHAPWIDSIRATTFGVLVLGSRFNWPDFIAYAAGIGAGATAGILCANRRNPSDA